MTRTENFYSFIFHAFPLHMTTRDLLAWTSMILGLQWKRGELQEAFSHFEDSSFTCKKHMSEPRDDGIVNY